MKMAMPRMKDVVDANEDIIKPPVMDNYPNDYRWPARVVVRQAIRELCRKPGTAEVADYGVVRVYDSTDPNRLDWVYTPYNPTERKDAGSWQR